MARFLVEYDYEEVIDTSWYDENDEFIDDSDTEYFSGEIVIEADDEEQARDSAYDQLGYLDNVYVWSVRPTTMSEED